MNGEYDTITPLAHARRAMERFERSVLQTHGGFRHGAFAFPLSCIQKYVGAYFADGSLPEPETHCEPDLGI